MRKGIYKRQLETSSSSADSSSNLSVEDEMKITGEIASAVDLASNEIEELEEEVTCDCDDLSHCAYSSPEKPRIKADLIEERYCRSLENRRAISADGRKNTTGETFKVTVEDG